MTSSQIRQSFLDFFRSKQHTIVPSSSLMPDAPNLLFTNAGMNQFVPIFLGQAPCPFVPPRAADTQKCIRAGGKHNDLEDVGLDTYHHTFFEMLGNWSFGDYFKKEAIAWAWELVVGIWKFPPQRIYATVYAPNKSAGDPADFDQEAYDFWSAHFKAAGLDPAVHIVRGNKKDNFWMMGETGPCGPCSELHVDLTPAGDTRGSLVNKGRAECIEIWNLVFIQFNANPDGSFSPLPATHVDTGMGFERVTSILQNTRNFTDFSQTISNYETDVFRPLFAQLEKLSGKHYRSTLPAPGSTGETEQEKIDIAFRVIADHIRTLAFAIADGIEPGKNEREYVLRRILRRAVRYGRTLGFREPFFYKLAEVVADSMGGVFPEIRTRLAHVQRVIRKEEEDFHRTIDTGLEIFQSIVKSQERWLEIATSLDREFTARDWNGPAEMVRATKSNAGLPTSAASEKFLAVFPPRLATAVQGLIAAPDPGSVREAINAIKEHGRQLSGAAAFKLYDTYGFPLDLTELMAREANLTVDTSGFEELMEEQRKLSRAAQRKVVIGIENLDTAKPTRFVGYDQLETDAEVLELVSLKDQTGVVLDVSSCYAEMGGQVGDSGRMVASDSTWDVLDTRKIGNTFVHLLTEKEGPCGGSRVQLTVNRPRRESIQRHHTVTHLLHWALHEVVSRQIAQKGSFVGPDKLTFDFNSAALSPEQITDIERLVNERILENAPVTWMEASYASVKQRPDVMQFFGDKYGDQVRVVQIGGQAGMLDGYSMELCGGTHTRATGEIGAFRIVGESGIAAGVRRIEAVAGLGAYHQGREELAMLNRLAARLNAPIPELEKKLESFLTRQKDLEKELRRHQQQQAADIARGLMAGAAILGKVRFIARNLGAVDGNFLQDVADALKNDFNGVVVLGGARDGAVSLVATVSPPLTPALNAGKIMQTLAPIVSGKGGGKPESARGGGKDPSRLDEALGKVAELLGPV